MMRFSPSPEPEGFDSDVRQKGRAWLAANPTGRPPDYWSPFRPQLRDAFCWLCAYTVMRVEQGTVDHFVSCDEDRSRAYEWDNYRLAQQWLNSSKSNVPGSAILDPFLVCDEWFEIHLPSLQLVLTDAVPDGVLAKARYTLKRLKLVNGEQVVSQRQSWLRLYESGKLSLAGLREVAPLLARAVEKRDATT